MSNELPAFVAELEEEEKVFGEKEFVSAEVIKGFRSRMGEYVPDLPVWRCTADEWHRFWLSKLGEGRKAKRIGVWLGHSRADPGSGPGEIPE